MRGILRDIALGAVLGGYTFLLFLTLPAGTTRGEVFVFFTLAGALALALVWVSERRVK